MSQKEARNSTLRITRHTHTKKELKQYQRTSFTGRPCTTNGVDDPAFLPADWVVIISNHNVGVLTVHNMNYSSFPLHWLFRPEVARLHRAPFTWFHTRQVGGQKTGASE